MLTLTNGFKKPQNGDDGSVWFPAMEDNIQQLNDHNHNGVNSELIPSYLLTPTTQAISSAGWVATSGGTYRQLVTVPNSKNVSNGFVVFKNSSTFSQMFLQTEYVSATTYYVYINDNSVSLTAYYLS